MNTTIWIALFVAFVLVEAFTYQMLTTWFAIGAAASALCAALGMETSWQVIIFVCVSLLCLIALRPIAVKCLKGKVVKTNADSLIGDKVTLTTDTDEVSGISYGRINGMEWSVKTENGEKLKMGETAYVKRIEGVKLIVSKTKGE